MYTFALSEEALQMRLLRAISDLFQNTVREIHTEGLIHDAIIEDIGGWTNQHPPNVV